MRRSTLELVLTMAEGGTTLLCCPSPGRVRWDRPRGETLLPGRHAGLLVRDGVVFDLIVPAGISGSVLELRLVHRWSGCGFGEPLALLGPVARPVSKPSDFFPDKVAGEGGLYELRAPTHGTFYLRPGPGMPPFAPAGTLLESGDTVGLVEVMKCFSPILFQPAGGARRGTVRQVLAAEGAEVQVEQVLMRIELD